MRDFIDSLYWGYPVGYLIAWRNPNVRLKDGTQSRGTRILIDGQQRVTALLAALLGKQIVTKAYKTKNITIAFHPGDEKFEVANSAIRKNSQWIADIASVFAPNTKIRRLVEEYCGANPSANKDDIYEHLEQLLSIKNNSLGLIELNADLDVETVAEIFHRVNAQGVPLNEADFAMSKMAANEKYDGHQLRKCIDYFCHLSKVPEAYTELAKDRNFADTDYFRTMAWLKNDKGDIYDPGYSDMLRVTFTSEFKRGRLADLVALLSGRDFNTRAFEESIAEDTYRRLKTAIMRFMNETNFNRFIMILRSAGFIDASMIQSKNTINFSYILYLTLRDQNIDHARIETLVRKWFVMSVLTKRYSGSFETTFGSDIRNISVQGAEAYLGEVQQAELSDVFWSTGLPQQMVTSVASSSYFQVFLASQVKNGDKGFLSSDHTVQTLLEGQSNVHHVFPCQYLKDNKLAPSHYNQIANYVVMQSEINIAISNKPPEIYFPSLRAQCEGSTRSFGSIVDIDTLQNNFSAHCIPWEMEAPNIQHYGEFLKHRRRLMSTKIEKYYATL